MADIPEPTRLLRLEQVPLNEHEVEGQKVEAWEVRTPEGARAYVMAFEESVEGAFERAGGTDQIERIAREMGRLLGGARGILTVVPPGCKLRVYEVREAPIVPLPVRAQ